MNGNPKKINLKCIKIKSNYIPSINLIINSNSDLVISFLVF